MTTEDTPMRAARKRARLSTREVADKVGISQSRISLFERGEGLLHIHNLAAYARAVGMSDLAAALAPVVEATKDAPRR